MSFVVVKNGRHAKYRNCQARTKQKTRNSRHCGRQSSSNCRESQNSNAKSESKPSNSKRRKHRQPGPRSCQSRCGRAFEGWRRKSTSWMKAVPSCKRATQTRCVQHIRGCVCAMSSSHTPNWATPQHVLEISLNRERRKVAELQAFKDSLMAIEIQVRYAAMLCVLGLVCTPSVLCGVTPLPFGWYRSKPRISTQNAHEWKSWMRSFKPPWPTPKQPGQRQRESCLAAACCCVLFGGCAVPTPLT